MPDIRMLNTEWLECWPRGLIDANGSLEGRDVSEREWILRDKRNGQFVLEYDAGLGLLPAAETPIDEEAFRRARQVSDQLQLTLAPSGTGDPLRLDAQPFVNNGETLRQLASLGLDAADYRRQTGLEFVAEPSTLWFAGFDRYRRTLWMDRDAAPAWNRMKAAAFADGMALEAISGYRSHFYQIGILLRKIDRGQTLDEILTVNAAPGFSEHHSGRAIDISTPGEPAAEESFELTEAFDWLQKNAAAHGFSMSYPRGNPHGITYEPWHWAYGR